MHKNAGSFFFWFFASTKKTEWFSPGFFQEKKGCWGHGDLNPDQLVWSQLHYQVML